MLKLICVCGAAFCALSLIAATRLGPFEMEESGEIRVEGLTFQLSAAGADWKWSRQAEDSVTPDAGMPVTDADDFRLSGVWKVPGGEFRLEEHVRRTGPDAVELDLSIASERGVATKLIQYEVSLPHRLFVSAGVLVNGRKIGFAEKFNDEKWQVDAGGGDSVLTLPLPNGILTVSGRFGVFLQDDRKFGHENWVLRLRGEPNGGIINRKAYQLSMKFVPYEFHPVSIGGVANLDFRDEVAGDGKGGWTDQGPENDMRAFPVDQRNFAGVEFDVTDPARNGGKAVIGLYCEAHAPTYPKAIELPVGGVQGKYLYLLHALGWAPVTGVSVGWIEAQYADGTSSANIVRSGVDCANFWRPNLQPNAAIGWTGRNASAQIGVSVSHFELEDKPVQSLTFHATGHAIWLIAGVSFSDSEVPIVAPEIKVMRANRDWQPLKSFKMVKPGSVLDFSELLDAPAGKYGFLKAVEGKFEFENRPGVPVRFFGGNIAYEVNFMRNELCDKLADALAGMGYNLLRLHHFDKRISRIENGRSTNLNPETLDRMDYMISAMKKRGIYITLDLYIIRELARGEVEELPDIAVGQPQFKALVFISESAMKSWEDFSRNLLTHVNPYTKLAWKDDPAIVTISLINEDTIFAEATRDPRVAELYRRKFKEWAAARKIAITAENQKRQWEIFLSETYMRGYRRMSEFLRNLGVRALLTDQNMWATIPVTLMRNDYDLVDNHFYDNHPSFLETPWRLPMSIENRSVISAFGGRLAYMFPSRIFGKPFSVSEWDFCNPGEYVTEGFLMTGAYAALQEWDALCQFDIACVPERVEKEDSFLALFDTLNDPLRTLANRGAALFFLRGDVRPAAESWPFLLPSSYLADGYRETEYPDVLERLGLVGRVGSVVASEGAIPVLPDGTRAVLGMEKNRPRTVPEGKPYFTAGNTDATLQELLRSGALDARLVDPAAGRYTSDTGEITLAQRDNTFQVTTPRSECFVLPEGRTLSGNYATIENKRSYGSFLIAARDDKPLAESRRVLILHLTDSKSLESRFRTDDYTIIEEWGKPVILLKRGNAFLTLKAPEGLKVYACRTNGERIGEVPFEKVPGGIRFEARTLGGAEPVVVYELAE